MDGEQAPAASALQLSTFTKVHSISRSDKFPDFPVTVRLTAPGADQTVRAPVDIVVAIDVSMSTKTNDPRLTLEKAAMKLVIDMLGPDDRLAVLPFSDGKSKVMFSGSRFSDEEYQKKLKEMSKLNAMTNVRKRDIRPLVEALAANGGTKLIVPIIEAEKILRERGNDDRTSFIILLSDGEDTGILKDKVWSIEGELKNGIKYRVHTSGFANPSTETLKHIATKTQGTHFAHNICGQQKTCCRLCEDTQRICTHFRYK